MTSRRSEESSTMPSHPYDHTPVTRRVVITHDTSNRVTGVALEADPGEQLPDIDLTAWAGAFTVETSLVGDEREVILRFPDCGAEHVPVIERRRLCEPGGGTVTSRRAFQGQDHSDGLDDLAAALAPLIEARVREARNEQALNIIFDGPPSHETGRFVEVETDEGCSVKAGEWVERKDGFWALRIEGVRRG